MTLPCKFGNQAAWVTASMLGWHYRIRPDAQVVEWQAHHSQKLVIEGLPV